MENEVKKETRKNGYESIHQNIVEISRAGKRKPATLKIVIPDALAANLMRSKYCPDDFPKIMRLAITWLENLTDIE